MVESSTYTLIHVNKYLSHGKSQAVVGSQAVGVSIPMDFSFLFAAQTRQELHQSPVDMAVTIPTAPMPDWCL